MTFTKAYETWAKLTEAVTDLLIQTEVIIRLWWRLRNDLIHSGDSAVDAGLVRCRLNHLIKLRRVLKGKAWPTGS